MTRIVLRTYTGKALWFHVDNWIRLTFQLALACETKKSSEPLKRKQAKFLAKF